MGIHAGRLRHRIAIQQKIETQDTTTGAIAHTWQTIAGLDSVPAAIEPLSVRDLMAAQAAQSEITARITIRYRAGLDATMRILHKDKIYNPAGWLPDQDSGLEYLTAPVSQGINDG
nr:phage head closure protein [uncultured Pseudomonas sp.]